MASSRNFDSAQWEAEVETWLATATDSQILAELVRGRIRTACVNRRRRGQPDGLGRTVSTVTVPQRLSREEIREMSRGLEPPTADDVSITSDGVRLDSKEKVIAFFEQLDRNFSVEADAADAR